ncbi:MAG TPA: cyclic nucleotide-binding domain-containing protein [Methylomirabilota bacterium]|nr:cyclic nucleotide-binding domain-containing protein [Methylomirabilota bacterium]
MELVGRMMDGTIPPPGGGPKRGFFGWRVSQDAKVQQLQRVPLLAECSRRQLRAVAQIAEIRELPAGGVVTRAGDPGDEFFVIIDGRARAEVSSRKRPRLGPGDFFGEMSLLDGERRSATVVAETPVRLLVIPRREFSRVLAEVPDLTRNLLAVLSRRLRQAEQALNA